MISQRFFEEVLGTAVVGGSTAKRALTPGVFSGLLALGGRITLANQACEKGYHHELCYMTVTFHCETFDRQEWKPEDGVFFTQDDNIRHKRIAFRLVKWYAIQNGFPGKGFGDELAVIAGEIGVKESELVGFCQAILPDIIACVFEKSPAPPA